MKKILIVIAGLFLATGVSFAATYQPMALGWGTVALSSGTWQAIAASTPTTVGEMRYCTNCPSNGGLGTICVSTESANAQNAFVLSTGTVCK